MDQLKVPVSAGGVYSLVTLAGEADMNTHLRSVVAAAS